MSDGSVKRDRQPAEQRGGITESVIDYCMPDGANVKGPERAGRAVIGLGIGGFGITGAVAASQPVLGVGMSVVLLFVAGYLLLTAKTKKCPVKHVTRKQLAGADR